jgi:polysaccharide deacetylase 2 family uncharacterized protein YibQ
VRGQATPVSRRGLIGALLPVALAGIAAVHLLADPPPGWLRYVDVPVVVLPLAAPAVPEVWVEHAPGAAQPVAGEWDELAAVEPSPAHPPRSSCATPCAAVIVTGLGLAQVPSARALALPPEIGLSFSPYADHAAAWQARARAAGHEVLLDLPLQPRRFPADDGGPLMIPVAASPAGQEETLLRVLATSSGYVGVAAAAEAFAAEPARFAPIAHVLRARGLGFVELGGSALEAVAGEADLAYAPAFGRLDPVAERGAVDLGLDAVVVKAREAGWAVAFVPIAPVSLDRLAVWAEALPAKGVTLVSPGTVLAARSSTGRQASNSHETLKP